MKFDSPTQGGAKPPPANDTLDAKGLLCPEPLMLVRNKIRSLNTGEVLHISATDPSTERDFHNLCRFMGHELTHMVHCNGVYQYWLTKG